MRYKNIFPYKNRSLAMQEIKTPKDARTDLESQVLILISNLNPDDEMVFPKATLSVVSIDDESITYLINPNSGDKFGEKIEASEIKRSILFDALMKTFALCPNPYASTFASIMERDPSIFRLREGGGWIINDELCLSSGNVSYKKGGDKLPTPLPLVAEQKKTVEATNQNSFNF